MEKMAPVNYQRSAKKHPKNISKKKQPLKVVYITNPIKFKTSASEFRALVQELTGRDADTPDPASFAVEDGGGEAADTVKVAAEDSKNVHAASLFDEETKIGYHYPTNNGEVVVQDQGSDPSATGSYSDVFVSPQMIENFHGLVSSNLFDVLNKSLDTM